MSSASGLRETSPGTQEDSSAGPREHPPGLREQKKSSTRAALTDRALQLADERGYDGFTISELVDLVGVSRRTFSNYFASKAECLAAVIDDWMDAALELIDSTSVVVPLTDLLRRVLEGLAEQIDGSRTGILALATTEPELAAAMATREGPHSARIAAVIAARTLLPVTDIRVSLLAEFSLTAGRTCIERWVISDRAGGRASLERDLDQAFSLIDFNRLLDRGAELHPPETPQ